MVFLLSEPFFMLAVSWGDKGDLVSIWIVTFLLSWLVSQKWLCAGLSKSVKYSVNLSTSLLVWL